MLDILSKKKNIAGLFPPIEKTESKGAGLFRVPLLDRLNHVGRTPFPLVLLLTGAIEN